MLLEDTLEEYYYLRLSKGFTTKAKINQPQ